MEVRGVEQDIIPYVGQLLLANVPVQGLIIHPYEHSLRDGPGNGCYFLPTIEELPNLI